MDLRRYDEDKAFALMDGAATVARIVRTAGPEKLRSTKLGDRSALDVIGHLTDIAEVFAERARRALEEDTPALQAVRGGAPAEERDPMELSRRLLQAHQRIVALMQRPGAADRPAIHSDWGRVNAGHIAAYQAEHTDEHVRDLAAAFPPVC